MSMNQNSGYGQALLASLYNQVGVLGNVHMVMDPDDTDEKNYQHMQDLFPPDTDGNARFFTSVEDAYDACESNNNDVILLDANSTHQLAAGLLVSKSRVNFVGMDGGDRLLQQGAKIQLPDALTDAYVLRVTGTRNSFRNIKFMQSSTEATSLHVLEEGGEGTLYKNCSFVVDTAANKADTALSEVIMGGDSCTFINCEFGLDTLTTNAATRTIMTIDTVTGGASQSKNNKFVDCTWIGSSTDADLQCISTAAAADLLFTTHLIRPSFIASICGATSAIECTKAVSTANGTANGMLLISYPMVHGFADIGVNGTNNDGLYVFSHVPSAVDITSAQPTTT